MKVDVFSVVLGFFLGLFIAWINHRAGGYRRGAAGDGVRSRARDAWRHWDRDEIEHELKASELIVELNADQAAQLEQAIEKRAADPNAPMRVLFEDEPPAVKLPPSSQGGSS